MVRKAVKSKMKYVWRKHSSKYFKKGKIGMQRQNTGGQDGQEGFV